MLPRAHRLRRTADIRHVRLRGLRRNHPLLHLYAANTGGAHARFAIAVSARLGNAVVRNRVRRRIREAIRGQLAYVQPGWDFLFVVRDRAVTASFQDLESAVAALLSRAEVLNNRAN